MSENGLYHYNDSGYKVDLSKQQEQLYNEAFDPANLDEYIVNGAILTCSKAVLDVKVLHGRVYNVQAPETTTILNVTENPKARCCGYLYHATVKDRKVGDNVPPFRCNCSREPHNDKEWAKLEEDESCITEGTCKALINLNDEWDNLPAKNSYLMFWNEDRCGMVPGITMSSMLFCRHGGIITPVMSGQTTKLYATNLDMAWYNYNAAIIKKIYLFNPKYNELIRQFREAYENNKSRYMGLARQMGIPPELLAVIHYRENSADYMQGGFNVYLHNGQTLGQVTTIVPTGKLYTNFDDAALNAIAEKSSIISQLNLTYETQDMTAMLCFLETYNGLGYYKNNRVNPYLYSGTNVYTSGKYVADGVYDPNAVDNQVGGYILLDALLSK